jgi:membrane protease YdiL (CAAX protease family)
MIRIERLRGLFPTLSPTRYDVAFLILWLLAIVALALGGDRDDFVQGLAVAAVLLLLYAVTSRFTDPAVVVREPPRNVVAGAAVVTMFLVLIGVETVQRNSGGLVGAWSALHWGATRLLAPIVPFLDAESLDNTIRYVVFPSVVLVLLGWRSRDLGFGRSRRGTVRSMLLWSVLPLVGYGVAAFAIGHGKPQALAHRFFIDIFRNGYAEEILFRGMVLRMTALAFGSSAGNLVQTIVFGMFHVGSDLIAERGVVWLALADAIATQAVAGYFFGLLTLRTGNVLASGAAHTLYDGGAIFV